MPPVPRKLEAPPGPGITAAADIADDSPEMPFEPLPVQELWRMVFDAPFTSPETQRIQQRFGSSIDTLAPAPELERTPVSELGEGPSPEEPGSTPPPERAGPPWGQATKAKGISYEGQKFTHPTSGLPGYPAVDLFGKPGTPFLAPEDGKIIRHSGKGGTRGQVYGYTIYFKGKSGTVYFITHLGKARAPKGSYKRGQKIGSIGAWKDGSPHAHVGVKRPSSGSKRS